MSESWNDVNQEINELNILSNDAVLISDAGPELKNSLATDEKKISTRLYTRFFHDSVSYCLILFFYLALSECLFSFLTCYHSFFYFGN